MDGGPRVGTVPRLRGERWARSRKPRPPQPSTERSISLCRIPPKNVASSMRLPAAKVSMHHGFTDHGDFPHRGEERRCDANASRATTWSVIHRGRPDLQSFGWSFSYFPGDLSLDSSDVVAGVEPLMGANDGNNGRIEHLDLSSSHPFGLRIRTADSNPFSSGDLVVSNFMATPTSRPVETAPGPCPMASAASGFFHQPAPAEANPGSRYRS